MRTLAQIDARLAEIRTALQNPKRPILIPFRTK